MKKLAFTRDVASLLRGAEELIVIGTQQTLARLPKVLDAKLQKLVVQLAKDASPGDLGTTRATLTGQARPKRLVVGALPKSVSRYNSEARPEAVNRVVKSAGLKGKKTAVLCVLEKPELLVPTLNAVARAFPLFSLKSGKKSIVSTVQVLAVDKKGKPVTADKAARVTAETVREVARLVDAPPTDMNPEALAKEARKLLTGIPNLRVTTIVGDALLKKKLAVIHAVGRTAVKAPRMLVATYTPRGAKRHIALVGKGITYDTGGLHIKGRGGMEGMKCDMGGSAAVLGAFRVLAKSGCKHKLSLVMCLAENAIGSKAFKPDDVLTQHSGLTVEINNTDAEGRLVLGDGVSYAARVLKCDTILDAATLTGAQMVSTGTNHAAIFSNSDKLEKLVCAAGMTSGDLVHPLPFAPEFYKREFKSAIADMRNSVRNRSNAQASCAAQFIYWHIEDTKADWCHVDLAGPAFVQDRGTGFGTALLAEAVRRL